MNNIKTRKYARTSKKVMPTNGESDEAELSFSATVALGILGGTFLIGLVSGKLLSMCKKKYI